MGVPFHIHAITCLLMDERCHLLAPTASDLVKYGKKDTILAGFHTDLNFLTIHGRSRYPGLNIWARNTGRRIPVKLPATGSYLFVQAGKQLEHITGGLIKAGFHEVVVNDATLKVCHALRYYLRCTRFNELSDRRGEKGALSGSSADPYIFHIFLAPLRRLRPCAYSEIGCKGACETSGCYQPRQD